MDVLIELFDPKTGFWHPVVCIEGFGSCNYTNVCELLSLVTQCPDPLIAAGIPCECPFMQVCYGNVLNTCCCLFFLHQITIKKEYTYITCIEESLWS